MNIPGTVVFLLHSLGAEMHTFQNIMQTFYNEEKLKARGGEEREEGNMIIYRKNLFFFYLKL